MATLLAHQGGWDEFALVMGPIIVLAALLKLANIRADRISGERDNESVD